MRILTFIIVSLLELIPAGQAYLKQLQPRDSILIADQIEYGFRLDSVRTGTKLALPDFSGASNDTLTLVSGWQIDTLTKRKTAVRRGMADIRAHMVLAPFEEGKYRLPDIPVLRDGDTLVFEGLEMEVKTMPVDTSAFEIHDIKGQMTYPVTFREVLPWAGAAILLGLLVAAAVYLIRRRMAGTAGGEASKEPAYIIALRRLDKYRGDKYWAPEKQKTFYSGITDTLKFYIDERFGIDAPEMTTAELFAALKGGKELTPELFSELKELFERADFVKFAKFTASDEENAAALPLAVRFVTSTYQSEIEEESMAGADGGEAGKK